MDTSPEYVGMCAKAWEIQKLRPVGREWEEGDYYHHHSDWNKCYFEAIASSDNDWQTTVDRDQYETWFPRQDQLQEMVIDKYKDHWGKAIYPGLMEEAVGFASQYPYGSMEQLWLAFVMHEKHGKVWNGTDWEVR